MAIGYDNEAGCCLPSTDLQDGHWYQDAALKLFIVPRNGEIEGPDGDVLDALNVAYFESDFDKVDVQALAQRLDLEPVYDWQKRFDRLVGYYAV